MALIQYNYKSQSLSMNVSFTVILPTDGLSFYDPDEAKERGQNPILRTLTDVYEDGMKFQTVYLYHGGGEDHSVTCRYAALERAAQENKVMLVCPNIQFFGTDCGGGNYFTYLTQELPKVVRTVLPSSPAREDNFVAGYAMGANVALGIAILRPDLFQTCLDISGGIGFTLKTQTMIDELRSDHFRTYLPSYGIAFGSPEQFAGSRYDLWPIAKKFKEEGTGLSSFILACGKDEFIRGRVEDDVKCLRELGYPVQYICAEGYSHNWEMWEKYLIEGLNCLLPLKRSYLYAKERAAR